MADATNTTPETLSPQAALRAEIATRLATSGKDVREIVIADLTKAEIDRRAGAVKTVITKIDDKVKELKKAEKEGKPAGFTKDGVAVGDPIYTKEQAEAIKKINEEITKLQAALTKAFDEGDFSKLLELGK